MKDDSEHRDALEGPVGADQPTNREDEEMGAFGIRELLLLLLPLVLFLALREFWCWYWKVNRIVALLERIEAKLSAPPKSGE